MEAQSSFNPLGRDELYEPLHGVEFVAQIARPIKLSLLADLITSKPSICGGGDDGSSEVSKVCCEAQYLAKNGGPER